MLSELSQQTDEKVQHSRQNEVIEVNHQSGYQATLEVVETKSFQMSGKRGTSDAFRDKPPSASQLTGARRPGYVIFLAGHYDGPIAAQISGRVSRHLDEHLAGQGVFNRRWT